MTLLELLVLGLATWRIASLLATENGPYAIFAKFRDFVGVSYGEYSTLITKNQFAEMISCVWCVSIYIGAIWAVLYYLYPPIVWIAYPLAISAIAVVIQELLPE